MELQGSLLPHLLPHSTFHAGHGDPNSGPHAYMDAILPDDQSPHLLFCFSWMVLVHSLGWSGICCAAQAAPTFLFLYFSCPSAEITCVHYHAQFHPQISRSHQLWTPGRCKPHHSIPALSIWRTLEAQLKAPHPLRGNCFSGTRWGKIMVQ